MGVNENLSDEEYIRHIGAIHDKIKELAGDDDYVINQPQMDKFIEVFRFFLDMCRKSNGMIEAESLDIMPKEGHEGLTARFLVFDIFGEDIQRFGDIIKYTSALTIDGDLDHKICISVTVPDVFIPASGK